MRFIILFALLFIGCNKKNKTKIEFNTTNNTTINDTTIDNITSNFNISKPEKTKITTKIISIDDINCTKTNNKIIYNFKSKKILVFVDNSKNSTLQLQELNKSKKKFYIIHNQDLENYFNIVSFPTIVIVDNNSTKKYEGFIPYEVLKYEIKE